MLLIKSLSMKCPSGGGETERLEFLSNIDIYGPLFSESRCLPPREHIFSLLISHSHPQISQALGLLYKQCYLKKSNQGLNNVREEFKSLNAVDGDGINGIRGSGWIS